MTSNNANLGIGEWVFPPQVPTMTTKITLDNAGRVLIPKPLRQKFHLGPGDTLQLESEGDEILLRPIRPQALLGKEQGVWVFQGDAVPVSIPDLIDEQRQKRISELLGG